jgi:hypothetical protein
MSNLLVPVEAQLLETVTGGAATRSCSSGSDALTSTLTQLQSTISSLSQNNNNNGGFSTTEAMMLGLMMSQRNTTVVVRRPYW